MNSSNTIKLAWALILFFALSLTILFFTISPQNAGLFGILAAVVALYGVSTGIILLIGNLIIRKRKSLKRNQSAPAIRSNYQQLIGISVVLALAPTLLIVLNSLGSIGVIELTLVLAFEIIVIFLVKKKG